MSLEFEYVSVAISGWPARYEKNVTVVVVVGPIISEQIRQLARLVEIEVAMTVSSNDCDNGMQIRLQLACCGVQLRDSKPACVPVGLE